MTQDAAPPTSFDTDADLLDQAIASLRDSGRIVQKLADLPGCYRVDGGSPLTASAIVMLAWDQGVMPFDDVE